MLEIFIRSEGLTASVTSAALKESSGIWVFDPFLGIMCGLLPRGDVVSGSIDEILSRKNEFARPLVANIDLLFIVLSAENPPADLLLADKLIVYGLYNDVNVVLGINKIDVGQSDALIHEYAGSDASVVAFSAKEGDGMKLVRELLRGQTDLPGGAVLRWANHPF